MSKKPMKSPDSKPAAHSAGRPAEGGASHAGGGHGHGHGHEHGHGHGHGHEHPHGHEHAGPGHAHEDDLIVVPKGETRMRFYFKFGLLVFLLVIFVVPGALMSSLTSGTDISDKVYLSWTDPDGEEHEINSAEFVQRKRDLLTLDETAPAFARMRDLGNLAMLGLGDFDPKEEFDTARFLLLEDLARAQGIRATRKELAEAIQNLFGGAENYRAELEGRRAYLSPREFEMSLEKALVVRRFLGYLAAAAATADPAEVARRWQAESPEFAFEYIEVATADYADAARAELPDDAALQAWLDALPARQKTAYNTPVRWTAEFAYVPLAEGAQAAWPYEALLAKYPRPADESAEDLAQRYYGGQKFTRFNRAEPLETAEDPEARLYFPFEEVREQALREAPVFFALQDWHADLVKRMAEADAAKVEEPAEPGTEPAPSAPPIDLAAEAAALGLVYAAPGEAKSSAEWLEADLPWGVKDTRLAGRMGNVRESGKLVPSVAVDDDALVVVRIAERVEPGLPPFAEIRDKVAEDWVKEKQVTLATAALEAVRDLLGERPAAPEDPRAPTPEFEPKATAEAFAQAAQEKGFEVKLRDFAERESPRLGAEGEAPIAEFLSFQPIYYSLEDGAVPAARSDRTGAHAFLVRYVGKRDPDLSRMEPADLEQIRATLESESVAQFFERTFGSREYLEQNYQLRLLDQREKPEAPTKPPAQTP